MIIAHKFWKNPVSLMSHMCISVSPSFYLNLCDISEVLKIPLTFMIRVEDLF